MSSRCQSMKIDPFSCEEDSILSFLQFLLETGVTESTSRGYVAAISDRQEGYRGNTVGFQPLIRHYLKGARRLRPSRARLIPTWDLGFVLKALTEPPFKPLDEVGIEFLTLKTAFLLCVSRSLTFHLETKMPCRQTPSRKKKAVVFTNVTVNAYQSRFNAGFPKVCEIFKVCTIESLKYIREFHTPVCYCVDISTPRKVMLNETNCDWLFDMSVKRPHGRALTNECSHIFQTFSRQSEGLATRDYSPPDLIWYTIDPYGVLTEMK